MRFETKYSYGDRKTKARYVFLKYGSILAGKVLDVGADKCYLKEHLGQEVSYTGIGLGDAVDRRVDLEKEKVPFPDNSFDCVLCNDVLEHLDNIHEVFDELCRLTRRWLILSLPNPWGCFYSMLRTGYYSEGLPMKFYSLPAEPPEDRHKWFFSTEEAEKFILHRASKSGMNVVQTDVESIASEGKGIKGLLRRLAFNILVSDKVDKKNLYTGTLWAVLEKEGSS